MRYRRAERRTGPLNPATAGASSSATGSHHVRSRRSRLSPRPWGRESRDGGHSAWPARRGSGRAGRHRSPHAGSRLGAQARCRRARSAAGSGHEHRPRRPGADRQQRRNSQASLHTARTSHAAPRQVWVPIRTGLHRERPVLHRAVVPRLDQLLLRGHGRLHLPGAAELGRPGPVSPLKGAQAAKQRFRDRAGGGLGSAPRRSRREKLR